LLTASVSVTAAVNHFKSPDVINKIKKCMYLIPIVLERNFSNIQPQNTTHTFHAVLYYNTIMKQKYNLNFSTNCIWNFEVTEHSARPNINMEMPSCTTI
jgi:hypothetical protein